MPRKSRPKTKTEMLTYSDLNCNNLMVSPPKPFSVGAIGPGAKIQEWCDAAGIVVAYIDANGGFHSPGLGFHSPGLMVPGMSPVAPESIQISEYKLCRVFGEWSMMLRSRESMMAAIAVLTSLALTLATSDFKNALGLPKETWQALFVFGTAFAIVRVIVAAFRFFWPNGELGLSEMDDLIKRVKDAASLKGAGDGATVELKKVSNE